MQLVITMVNSVGISDTCWDVIVLQIPSYDMTVSHYSTGSMNSQIVLVHESSQHF